MADSSADDGCRHTVGAPTFRLHYRGAPAAAHSAAMRCHPSRAFATAGAHPVAVRRRSDFTRCDRLRYDQTSPSTLGPTNAGSLRGGLAPAACAIERMKSPSSSGSSSATLYTPAGACRLATTADAASSTWIDEK